MNDVMLYAKLKTLGVPDAKAWDLTRRIRDVYHPVAAIAAHKILSRTAQGLGAPGAAAAVSDAGIGMKLASAGFAAASAVGAGAAAGSVVPVIGTAIGAIVGLIAGALIGPAKLGQSSVVWNGVVSQGLLQQHLGRAFQEQVYAEAMKGAMDEGNNVWPGCGPDRHKNPDCFYAPLGRAVIAGYLNKTVPLSATTDDVYNLVVVPWLQAGAGGAGFNYSTYASQNAVNGNMQGLLVKGAVDRYLAGMPIARADMPEYIGQGYTDHVPPLNVALAPLLQTTAAPSASPSVALAQSPAAVQVAPAITAAGQQLAAQVVPASASGSAPSLGVPSAQISAVATPAGVTPPAVVPVTQQQDTTAALLQQILANQQNANLVSPQAQQLLANIAANGVQQTPYGPPPGGIDLSQFLLPGAILGGGLLLFLALKK